MSKVNLIPRKQRRQLAKISGNAFVPNYNAPVFKEVHALKQNKKGYLFLSTKLEEVK